MGHGKFLRERSNISRQPNIREEGRGSDSHKSTVEVLHRLEWILAKDPPDTLATAVRFKTQVIEASLQHVEAGNKPHYDVSALMVRASEHYRTIADRYSGNP